MRRLIARADKSRGGMKRLIARVLDLGVVVLFLVIPTALGNRADPEEPSTAAAPVASYCDSLCSGRSASLADED